MARARVFLEDPESNGPPLYLGEREIRVGQIVLLSEDLGRRARAVRLMPRRRGELSDVYVRKID